MTILPPMPKQREAERFIERYTHEHDGVSPSYAEIGEALKITAQGAYGVVKGLVARGRLTKTRKPRSFKLVKGE